MASTVEELRPTGSDRELRSDDRLRPFSLKHARQQASIVAHMQRVGLVSPHHRSSNSMPEEGQVTIDQGFVEMSSLAALQQEGVASATVTVIDEDVGLSDGCQTVKAVSEPADDGTVPAANSANAGDEADQTVYVEFGAGTGYLSAHLAECTLARRLILLDRGSFRMKADRCHPSCLRFTLGRPYLKRITLVRFVFNNRTL